MSAPTRTTSTLFATAGPSASSTSSASRPASRRSSTKPRPSSCGAVTVQRTCAGPRVKERLPDGRRGRVREHDAPLQPLARAGSRSRGRPVAGVDEALRLRLDEPAELLDRQVRAARAAREQPSERAGDGDEPGPARGRAPARRPRCGRAAPRSAQAAPRRRRRRPRQRASPPSCRRACGRAGARRSPRPRRTSPGHFLRGGSQDKRVADVRSRRGGDELLAPRRRGAGRRAEPLARRARLQRGAGRSRSSTGAPSPRSTPTGRGFELIFVDDGSTDGTFGRIERAPRRPTRASAASASSATSASTPRCTPASSARAATSS